MKFSKIESTKFEFVSKTTDDDYLFDNSQKSAKSARLFLRIELFRLDLLVVDGRHPRHLLEHVVPVGLLRRPHWNERHGSKQITTVKRKNGLQFKSDKS